MNKTEHQITRIASGFTLIEVLVALVIVALGMLGNAMLQLQGMKNSNDAYLRSQIGLFAYDISDKIRANRECQNAYLAQAFFTVANPYVVGTSALPACVHGSPSGNAGMANEIACMGATLDQGLPPGSQASIFSVNVVPAGAARAITIFTFRVVWTDRDGEIHTMDYTFDPGACANAAACNCV
jgi:type IV pilus modification protein PilV